MASFSFTPFGSKAGMLGQKLRLQAFARRRQIQAVEILVRSSFLLVRCPATAP